MLLQIMQFWSTMKQDERGQGSVMRGKSNKKKNALIVSTTAMLALCLFAALVWTGKIVPNRLLAARYPVKGVDVSSYQ